MSHTELEGGRGEGSLHIQTVNDLTGHLKGWIRRFSGVRWNTWTTIFSSSSAAGPTRTR